MLRHPPARALVGLVVGFVAAYCTFYVVDQFGQREVRSGEQVFEFLDFDGYCSDRLDGGQPIRISDTAHGWLCGGRPTGIWQTEDVDIDDLCRWQYGAEAAPRLDDEDDPFGWRCVVAAS